MYPKQAMGLDKGQQSNLPGCQFRKGSEHRGGFEVSRRMRTGPANEDGRILPDLLVVGVSSRSLDSLQDDVSEFFRLQHFLFEGSCS